MLAMDEELQVEVETNGSVDIAEFKALTDRVAFTLDYKLPGSGMESNMCFSNYNYIDKKDAVKFVSGSIKQETLFMNGHWISNQTSISVRYTVRSIRRISLIL